MRLVRGWIVTTHGPHPDVHTHGLADDCERCFEIAEYPIGRADADLLLRLTIGDDLITDTDYRARQRLIELGVPVR